MFTKACGLIQKKMWVLNETKTNFANSTQLCYATCKHLSMVPHMTCTYTQAPVLKWRGGPYCSIQKKLWFLYYLPTPWPFCLLQVSNFGQSNCLENLLLMIRLLVWNCFSIWEFKFLPFWCRWLGYGTWRKSMPPMTSTLCIIGEFVHSCFALEWLYTLFTGFVIVNCEEKLWLESALTTDHEQDTT